MAHLLDKKVNGKYPFEYRNAAATDVAATIKRARERLEEAEKERKDNEAGRVSQLRSRR